VATGSSHENMTGGRGLKSR